MTERQKILYHVCKSALEFPTPIEHPIMTGPEEDLHETAMIKRVAAKFADIRLRAEASARTLLLYQEKRTRELEDAIFTIERVKSIYARRIHELAEALNDTGRSDS